MLEYIIHLDQQLFLLLNGAHCTWLDPVMIFFSEIPVWIPLYLAIIFFFFWKNNWKIGLLALLGAILTFALTDQLGVHLFKNTFQRLRPCHDPAMLPFVHMLESCGGQFSFISNHAANTFGLATFTTLFFRKKYYTWGIFLWAALVGYSRIYVGKHYPLDVLCGAAFGVLIGWLVYLVYKKLCTKIIRPKNPSPFAEQEI